MIRKLFASLIICALAAGIPTGCSSGKKEVTYNKVPEGTPTPASGGKGALTPGAKDQ